RRPQCADRRRGARAASPRLARPLAVRLALDELPVAPCFPQCGQSHPGPPRPGEGTPLHPPGCREPRDAPDEPAEEEGPKPSAPVAVHGTDCRVRGVICTLGDLLLDVIVRLDGPIAEDTDTYGKTRAGPGGRAANVAAWVAALGQRSRFVGKRARDPAGRILARELEGRGVELIGPEVESGTGTVVSMGSAPGG